MANVNDILTQKINEKGAISLEEYMATCLYTPNTGYYMTEAPFGERGDFTTAPEITQMFGEMLALWVVSVWKDMGEPTNFNFVEIGPGRGTLMNDIIRTVKNIAPDFHANATITLVEVSPTLTMAQQTTLEDESAINWATSIDAVDMTLPTILIGNELLDAFPIRQFEKANDAYIERMVTEANGTLTLTMGDKAHTFEQSSPVVETSPQMDTFLTTLKERMNQGAALFIDYGTMESDEFPWQDTLQALKGHEPVHILQHPGEADLTAHVNFTNVMNIFGENQCQYDDMGLFLTRLGLPARAMQLMDNAGDEDKKDIEMATYRLLHPDEMGHHFKVLAYRTPELKPTVGF